jgi:hypothetical protein
VLLSFASIKLDLPDFYMVLAGGAQVAVEGQVHFDRYRTVMKRLNEIPGRALTKEQTSVTEKFLAACLPHVVGQANFRANPDYFRRQCTEVSTTAMLACLMPRRFGKTTATASFVGAVMLSSPRIAIVVFSPTQRQSSMLTTAIKTLIQLIAPKLDRAVTILKDNEETIVLRFDNQREYCTLCSYPSSERGVRGATGDMVIGEEFMQLDPAFFRKVIVPMLGVADTTLLCISTPLGADSYYDELVKTRDTLGQPLFEVLQITLMCNKCLAANRSFCVHLLDRQPSWKPTDRLSMMKLVMQIGVDPDDTVFLNENMGVQTALANCVFARDMLDRWNLLLPSKRTTPYKNRVYVMIDPSGGGHSEIAIICLYLVQRKEYKDGLPYTARVSFTSPMHCPCRSFA